MSWCQQLSRSASLLPFFLPADLLAFSAQTTALVHCWAVFCSRGGLLVLLLCFPAVLSFRRPFASSDSKALSLRCCNECLKICHPRAVLQSVHYSSVAHPMRDDERTTRPQKAARVSIGLLLRQLVELSYLVTCFVPCSRVLVLLFHLSGFAEHHVHSNDFHAHSIGSLGWSGLHGSRLPDLILQNSSRFLGSRGVWVLAL